MPPLQIVGVAQSRQKLIFSPQTCPRQQPHEYSGTNMTGQPGYRTIEMIGGSSASYLAPTPCVPFCYTLYNRGGNRRVETEGLLDHQGRAGTLSIVQWNLRPVVFGVEVPTTLIVPISAFHETYYEIRVHAKRGSCDKTPWPKCSKSRDCDCDCELCFESRIANH